MANSTTPRKRITRPKTSAPRVARKKALADEAAAEIAPLETLVEAPPIVVEAAAAPEPEPPAPLPLPPPPVEPPRPTVLAAPPARVGRRRHRLLSSVFRRLRAAARRRGAPVVKRLVERFPLLDLLTAPLRRRLRLD